MRPNTMASGILITNRNRPVSTNMLTRILVPKPKNAFQSPGLHNIGRKPGADVDVLIARSCSSRLSRLPADASSNNFAVLLPVAAHGGDKRRQSLTACFKQQVG